MPARTEKEPSLFFLLFFILLCYLPFIFFGYGSDGDTANTVKTIQSLLSEHQYIPSRNPGHVTHEVSAAILSAIGGSALSNAGTVAMSLLAIFAFAGICRKFKVPHTSFLVLFFAFQPVYWVHSTYTIDFVWSLSLLLLGFLLMLEGKPLAAGLLFGLATGARITAAPLAALFALWMLLTKRSSLRQTIWIGIVALLVSVITYLPPFFSAGANFSFLINEQVVFTAIGWWGRFFYKNIYFWGLQTTLFLILITPWIFRGLRKMWTPHREVIALSIAMVVVSEIFFMSFPTKRPFLLPLLPFALILLGFGLHNRRGLLIALILVQISYNLIDFNIARPDVPENPSSAAIGFWIEPGYLLTEGYSRLLGTPRKP